MSTLSVISRAQAKRMLVDPEYRREMLGPGRWLSSEEALEWLARIAGGFTPCSGPFRHTGDCSGASGCVAAHNRAIRDGLEQLDLGIELPAGSGHDSV